MSVPCLPRIASAARALALRPRCINTLILLAFAGLLFVQMATAAPLRVAVDASGSMRGWFRTGALTALVADVRAAAEAANLPAVSKAFVADAGGEDAPAGLNLVDWDAWLADRERPWGRTTLLDAALAQSAEGARVVVVITDDFHDPGGAGGGSAGSTERFYQALGRLDAARGWLVPLTLPFDGNVDLAPGEAVPFGAGDGPRDALRAALAADNATAVLKGARVGTPRWVTRPTATEGTAGGFWKVPYTGPRTLALHLVLLRVEDLPRVNAFLDALALRRPELAPLLVHPMGADVLKLVGLPDAAPEDVVGICGEKPDATGAVTVRLDTEGPGPARLVPADAPLDPTQPVRLAATFAVVTTEAHLGLRSHTSACSLAPRAAVTDLRWSPRPGSADLFVVQSPALAAAVHAAVVPSRFAGPTALSADPATRRPSLFTLDLPALTGAGVPRARAAGNLAGSFAITVRLNRRHLGLTPDAQARWFTASPTDLQRLYSPLDIVSSLGEGAVEVRMPVQLDPALWAPLPPPPPALPAPPMPVWPFVAAAFLLSILVLIQPFGFVAAVLRGDGHHAHPVALGGLLRPRPAVRFALGGDHAVWLVRAPVWGRVLIVRDAEGRTLGHLRRGALPVEVALDEALVWLGPRAEKNAREAGTYDPRG